MSFATRGTHGRDLEWLFSSMMLAWGLYLWLPMPTFDGPQYALLKAIANEKVWGAFSVSIGGLRMVALTINGAIRQTPVVRATGATLGAVWWVTLTYLFMTTASQVLPAGVTWYPLFAIAEILCVIRSAEIGRAHV